jgi:hypothetical protein
MKRSLRNGAKRLAAPLLGPLDRRFSEFTEHQREELERLDERLEIDLRIVDEHLLAIRRATRRIETMAAPLNEAIAAAVADAIADAPGTVVTIATPGSPLAVPDGYVASLRCAFRRNSDGGWAAAPLVDDVSMLRVARLRPLE